jgi:UDP-N-acetylmuramoyl-L-alanyl-D-glutamate--2,6-diaminopimelate ligase
VILTERREAIEAACKLAKPNDVILIAGKGHENYQEINGVKHHFDDIEELNNSFKKI